MSLDVTLHPNPCAHCGRADEGFSANITHNLGKMASEAGIYAALWEAEDHHWKAMDIIQPLRDGIALMKSDPARFEAFNAANGWGTYEVFVPWCEEYLAACEANPDATISVSR